jgi:hypothetical protein
MESQRVPFSSKPRTSGSIPQISRSTGCYGTEKLEEKYIGRDLQIEICKAMYQDSGTPPTRNT